MKLPVAARTISPSGNEVLDGRIDGEVAGGRDLDLGAGGPEHARGHAGSRRGARRIRFRRSEIAHSSDT